ncbi:MAG: 5'-methylthioadenosine/adenosylhomocysteine nucleosidase [Bacteroidaceae bacterium]|nr:5'-methylthioadenosine/adenosylhomocysteine nucleosidase [Bacteroidaceae bacterium]
MRIGIIVAMSVEFDQLTRLMSGHREEKVRGTQFTLGQIGQHEIVLMQCGIGKVNAAMGTTLLIGHYTPDCIVSTGCAGGIDTCLDVMDVVVSTELAYHDVSIGDGYELGQVQGLPARFTAAKQLVEKAQALATNTKIHAGLICTGDQFITSKTELAKIKENFPEALAVDMESTAIAQVCYLQKVPFVSFRIISDTPGADAHQQQYNNFWGEMADRSFKVTQQFLTSL